jgi:aminobenzoyl-glutamate utilization protein B
VITDGGDQPNVVPQRATIWFYFRERDYAHVMAMFEAAKRMAQGAALMTDTKVDTIQIVGSAWPGHFNKAVAEATYGNIRRVGMPVWDAADQTLARALQRELGVKEEGLATTVDTLGGPIDPRTFRGGGSDDIGDISWNVPTVTLRYPSNIPGLPGHNWANGIAMATPLAHKGAVAGAKVQALTLLDLLLQPKIVADAWEYFREVQTKETKYTSFLGPDDKPPTWLNAEIMAKYRPLMQPFYYDATKHRTYLDQLGIQYPTVRQVP